MNIDKVRDITLNMMVLAMLTVAVSGCSRIHEPWVNNDAQWKEQQFKMNVPEKQLDQRLLTGQSDR
jgi:hypothetical protein